MSSPLVLRAWQKILANSVILSAAKNLPDAKGKTGILRCDQNDVVCQTKLPHPSSKFPNIPGGSYHISRRWPPAVHREMALEGSQYGWRMHCCAIDSGHWKK